MQTQDQNTQEYLVTINQKKTPMVALQECDEDKLIESDCSNLLLVQPNKGLFYIENNPKQQSYSYLEHLRQTNIFPGQMFCAAYQDTPDKKVAIVEYTLPLEDYILDAKDDPNTEDWYKFNKLYKIVLISKNVFSNVLKMLGLEQLCENKDEQIKRFKKVMRQLKQVHVKQRKLPNEIENKTPQDNDNLQDDEQNEQLNGEPIDCDPLLFLSEKKYIPNLESWHVGIKQDINLRLSSPEQIAQNVVFRSADLIENLNSGSLDQYIQESRVFELLKSIKGDDQTYYEFYDFFVIRQFFQFFEKLLHHKIFDQASHLFDCFQDKKYFREHSRCPVFIENVLDQQNDIDKLSILYLVMNYPFVDTQKMIQTVHLFFDKLAEYAKSKIQTKVKQIKEQLTGEVEQSQVQDVEDSNNINQRILENLDNNPQKNFSEFQIRGSYIQVNYQKLLYAFVFFIQASSNSFGLIKKSFYFICFYISVSVFIFYQVYFSFNIIEDSFSKGNTSNKNNMIQIKKSLHLSTKIFNIINILHNIVNQNQFFIFNNVNKA